MKVTVSSKKGDVSLTVGDDATVADLKTALSKEIKLNFHRIMMKHSGDLEKSVKVDDNSALLKSVSISNGSVLSYKDLGPQIGYRTVFYVEYGGPLVLVALMAFLRSKIFGAFGVENVKGFEGMDWVAQLAVWCWIAHFMKREFETAFVHKFSHPTMPIFNLFKNCGYYWTFGAVIAWPMCSPNYIAPAENTVYGGLALFVLSELSNFAIHLKLAGMRPKEGSKKRDIPKGFGFDLVACPNYFFEILAWVGFSIMTGIIWSWMFTLVGFLQMAPWAQKKHKLYKATYGKEYTSLGRKAIIPFLY